MAAWQISGEYMETCNCTMVCPCITSNLTGKPTQGDCKAALAMRIDKGTKMTAASRSKVSSSSC